MYTKFLVIHLNFPVKLYITTCHAVIGVYIVLCDLCMIMNSVMILLLTRSRHVSTSESDASLDVHQPVRKNHKGPRLAHSLVSTGTLA